MTVTNQKQPGKAISQGNAFWTIDILDSSPEGMKPKASLVRG